MSTQEPIITEQILNGSIQEVWEAITVLEKMKEWYFPMLTAFQPVVGFETYFTVSVEERVYPHQWKITEVIPNKSISYEWTFDGYEGKSVSQFQIFQDENGVRLKVTSTVLEDFPTGIPEFERESGVAGWNYLIKESLVTYLSSEA